MLAKSWGWPDHARMLFLIRCFQTRHTWPLAVHTWFLENALVRVFVYVSVCLYVCLPPGASITSGVIWCDIGRVRLLKQVLQLFPAFNYFIWHLPLIKWMGMAILTQHVMNACQRKLSWCGTSYKRTAGKTECFNYKSE